jgi:AI-2 transport protein TqsA
MLLPGNRRGGRGAEAEGMTVTIGHEEARDTASATDDRLIPQPLSALIVLILVLGAALLLREVSDIAVQLLCGGFLALIAWPMFGRLRRANVPTSAALTLTTLVMLSIVIAGMAIIAASVGELVAILPAYEDRARDGIESLRLILSQLGIATDPDSLLAILSPEQISAQLGGVASSVSNAGIAVVVIALTMIFALAGASTMQAQAEDYFGADHPVIAGVTRFGADARRYLLVRTELGAFSAVLSFLLLLVLGVPLPALWALLVFATSFIPNIGVLLGLIPPMVLALLDIGVGGAVAVVVGYGVINFVQDNLLQPIALGAQLNLSPLVGFVGFLAWTWIFGAAGAILAIPLTLALGEILAAYPSTRALAALMRTGTDRPAGRTGEQTGAEAVSA